MLSLLRISLALLLVTATSSNFTHFDVGHDAFELCRMLDLYGCSVQTIPALLTFGVDTSIPNYDMPVDPCEFDRINVTWIWSQIEGIDTYWSYFPVQSYPDLPCYLLQQEPLRSILSELDPDHSYLLDYTYWFGNMSKEDLDINNMQGHCEYDASKVLHCNGNHTFVAHNNTCIWPFVSSPTYSRDYLKPYGMEDCGLPCTEEWWLYDGDLQALDDFTLAAIIISLLLATGYAINVGLELKHSLGTLTFKKLCKKFETLPLTFDCPIFIALNLIGFCLVLAMPHILGKKHFNCTSDGILVHVVPDENVSCGVSGWAVFIFIHGCFWYTALLSFSVFRVIYNPKSPFFGIKKVWYHLTLWAGLLILFIFSIVENIYGNSPALGLCGPSLHHEEDTYTFVLVPLFIVTGVFITFTLGAVYLSVQHVSYESKVGVSAQVKKHLRQLTTRLIIYQILVGSACIAFITVVIIALNDYPQSVQSFAAYFACLALEGEHNRCKLGFTISNSVYYAEGFLVMEISLACFALSCSTRKVKSWKSKPRKMTKYVGSKMSSSRKVFSPSAASSRKKTWGQGKRSVSRTNEASQSQDVIEPEATDQTGISGGVTLELTQDSKLVVPSREVSYGGVSEGTEGTDSEETNRDDNGQGRKKSKRRLQSESIQRVDTMSKVGRDLDEDQDDNDLDAMDVMDGIDDMVTTLAEDDENVSEEVNRMQNQLVKNSEMGKKATSIESNASVKV